MTLYLALSFLTILPVPLVEYQPGGLGRSAGWFSLVGLAIGAISLGVYLVAHLIFSPLLCAVLTVLCWAALTGGLHLDGLADCCDGLLVAAPTEKRLEIMRDPRTGSFAVVGVVLQLMLKVAAVASLSSPILALLLTPAWARCLLLFTARQPLARPSGLAAEFTATLTTKRVGLALIVPAFLLIAFVSIQGVVACVAAWLVTLWLHHMARKRLGGVTGDVYGLVVEVSEVVMLLVFAATMAGTESLFMIK